MNEPTIRLETRTETRADVSAFVAAVRARLADLTDEERDELVGGLDADLHELVADGGSVAELGDPRAYADELRAAAGLERPRGTAPSAEGGGRRSHLSAGLVELPRRVLDGSRRRWSELVDVPALRGPWQFLVSLRPVWWVARVWVAIQLVAMVTQGWAVPTVLPLLGGPVAGAAIWVVGVVLSVQMGRNRVWPGSGPQRRTFARLVLVGLNAFAIVMVGVVVEQFPDSGVSAESIYGGGEWTPPGLNMGGIPVANVFPYDADGKPLEGVQLFDQDGNPLRVSRDAGEELDGTGERIIVTYPWFNGGQQLFNVFPLPRRTQNAFAEGFRMQPGAWSSTNPPVLPVPPLAAVPPVSLPGLAQTSTQESADGAEDAPAEDADGPADPEDRPGR